jgi:N-acetylglucosaminyldiphosphoundecaprenol N-acetyl-beta-D-mannosaminyltransferase
MKSKKINLFGSEIDSLTMDETIELVEQIIHDKTPCQHVVVNAMKFAMMRSDLELKRVINSCDLINADGLPVVWASRLLGTPLPARVAGVDLFMKLMETAARKGYRPFFFGARENVLQKTLSVIRIKYPQLDIAGFRHGYFSSEDEEGIAEQIKNSEAHMLFVGISSPLKEKFLNRWMQKMQVPFCMGVGGSFDIVAGITNRAPIWLQNLGLEWLYRIVQEPRRMWKRYARTNPIFIWMVLKAYVRRLEGSDS